MANQQPKDILKTPQAEKLLKNKSNLENLMKSPDTRQLMNMLNQSAGGGLKAAAEAAMKGDTSQIMGLMNQLMNDPEGAKVVDRINKNMPK
ncbi:MAG: hypothetical protein EOM52_11215 [Clostridia bacterium]|nr:hypothetical protein [Clostridia bacterium]